MARVYYAYDMLKRKPVNKRRAIIIGSLAALVGVVGSYFAYGYLTTQNTTQSVASSKAADTVKALNLEGDQDLAVQYVSSLKAGDRTKARKLFSNAIDAEPDTQKKIDLLTQNTLLALNENETDEALVAANQALSLRESEDTFSLVARVYVVKADHDKQIEYWQKALEAVRVSDVAGKEQLVVMYQDRIDSTKQAQELMDRARE